MFAQNLKSYKSRLFQGFMEIVGVKRQGKVGVKAHKMEMFLG